MSDEHEEFYKSFRTKASQALEAWRAVPSEGMAYEARDQINGLIAQARELDESGELAKRCTCAAHVMSRTVQLDEWNDFLIPWLNNARAGRSARASRADFNRFVAQADGCIALAKAGLAWAKAAGDSYARGKFCEDLAIMNKEMAKAKFWEPGVHTKDAGRVWGLTKKWSRDYEASARYWRGQH